MLSNFKSKECSGIFEKKIDPSTKLIHAFQRFACKYKYGYGFQMLMNKFLYIIYIVANISEL